MPITKKKIKIKTKVDVFSWVLFTKHAKPGVLGHLMNKNHYTSELTSGELPGGFIVLDALNLATFFFFLYSLW